MAREKAVILQEILDIKSRYMNVILDMHLIQYSPEDKAKLESLELELKNGKSA